MLQNNNYKVNWESSCCGGYSLRVLSCYLFVVVAPLFFCLFFKKKKYENKRRTTNKWERGKQFWIKTPVPSVKCFPCFYAKFFPWARCDRNRSQNDCNPSWPSFWVLFLCFFFFASLEIWIGNYVLPAGKCFVSFVMVTFFSSVADISEKFAPLEMLSSIVFNEDHCNCCIGNRHHVSVPINA